MCAGLVLVVSGCGSDDQPQGAPTPSTAASVSPTDLETETEASTSPTSEPEPATGPRLQVPEAALRLPDDDWMVLSRDTGSQSGGKVDDGIGYINISSFPQLSSTPDLDYSAEQVLDRFTGRAGFDVRPGEDLEIGGLEGRTFVGTSERGPFFVYLTIVGTTQASSLTVEIETSGSTRAHQRVVDSVMASLEWR